MHHRSRRGGGLRRLASRHYISAPRAGSHGVAPLVHDDFDARTEAPRRSLQEPGLFYLSCYYGRPRVHSRLRGAGQLSAPIRDPSQPQCNELVLVADLQPVVWVLAGRALLSADRGHRLCCSADEATRGARLDWPGAGLRAGAVGPLSVHDAPISSR